MKYNKKVVAIATGDWHIHPFNNTNDPLKRLDISLKVGGLIVEKAKRYGVPILFTGDFFHTPKGIPTEVHEVVPPWYKTTMGSTGAQIEFICIDGNHDLSQKNTLKNQSPSHLKSFEENPGFKRLNNSFVQGAFNTLIYGIPYYDYERDWVIKIKEATKEVDALKKCKKILLLHGNAPGAKTPQGFEIESKLNLKYLSKHWDLVLMGHIHKPQKLYKKVYMLGSPIQQTFGDEGTQMGYWEVYDDMTVKLIPLNNLFPEFVTLTPDQIIRKGDDNPKGDYIKVKQEPEIETEDELLNDFLVSNSRKKLAKNYLKVKGIKDKKKLKALINILQ